MDPYSDPDSLSGLDVHLPNCQIGYIYTDPYSDPDSLSGLDVHLPMYMYACMN